MEWDESRRVRRVRRVRKRCCGYGEGCAGK